MATTLQEMLYPQSIMNVVSRIREHRPRFCEFLNFLPRGMTIDGNSRTLQGSATKPVLVRSGTYRIYDNVRSTAPFSVPGQPPVKIALKTLGEANYTCPRLHPKISITYEELAQISPIMGPQSAVDSNGEAYLGKQIKTLAQKCFNSLEAMTLGLLRGGTLYLKSSDGNSWVPTFTAPAATTMYMQMNWQMPAGNKTQLDMLGAGNILTTTWDNPAAQIIKMLLEIDKAFMQLIGAPLRHVWLNGTEWHHVITNNEVRNLGGSAATPFAEWTQAPEKDPDGKETGGYVARLKAFPQVEWHVCNEVIEIDGSTVLKIPDAYAIFMPDLPEDAIKLADFAEPFVERPGANANAQHGFRFWSETTTQPSAVDIIAAANVVPLLEIPKAIAFGQIVF